MFIRFLKKANRRGKRPVLRQPARSRKGFSLVVALGMSVAISFFLMAMYQGLLPIYLRIVNMRYGDALRSANEGAVDWVLAKLNTQASMFTMPEVGNSVTVSSGFPTSVTNQGGTTFSPTVVITNLGSGRNGSQGPPQNSVVYNAARPGGDNFFVATATTVQGGLKKTLTVLFAPIAAGAGSINGNALSANFGLVAQNNVELFGKAAINGYNLPSNWTNPYQFADTMCNSSVTWQIGDNNNARGVLQGGSIFEYWQPTKPNPALPSGTMLEAQEPWMQIMGNVYSNYYDQYNNAMGYAARNQGNDTGTSYNNWTNTFGAANGLSLNGQGVPSGYPTTLNSTGSGTSVAIPTWTNSSTQLQNTNYASWGNNGVFPTDPSYSSNPNTGGYISSPGAGGQADPSNMGSTTNSKTTIDWTLPAAPTTDFSAPDAPTGTATVAANGQAGTGSYYSGSNPPNVIVNGTLEITNSVTAAPSSLSTVAANATVKIPPANYNFNTLQVGSAGKIVVDQNISGPTQFFVNPSTSTGLNGQGTSSAVYFANGSSVNMGGYAAPSGADATNFTIANGLSMHGTSGFGATPNDSSATTVNAANYSGNGTPSQLGIDTAHPITDAAGYSSQNLVINSNSNCNMLLAGNARAMVNAPNANVNVGYQKSNQSYSTNGDGASGSAMSTDANFFGAIVGGNATVCSDWSSGGGAYMHYDVSLKGAIPTFTDPWMFFNGQSTAAAATQWRAVTWQEQLTW